VIIPAGFNELSSIIISRCSFLQILLQQVIYITHGSEIVLAKKALKDFPNPKARIDFLCEFPYSKDDEVVYTVFQYAKSLFTDLYELRNILTHEMWSSSDEFKGSVIFSTLDEEARLLMASGRVWHAEDATPAEAYSATIRFINNVKIISNSDLHAALMDSNLCAWILMHIGHILDEQDLERRNEARRAFLVFKGTSHLFGDATKTPETISLKKSKRKTIKGDGTVF
jgi:hypothetical protein